MNKEIIKAHLKNYNFSALFNELGWDNHKQTVTVKIEDFTFILNAVAHKRGFVAFTCQTDTIPEYNIRRKIEQKLTKQVFEHIVIFTDKQKSRQKWIWVKREQGKPIAVREEEFDSYKSEALIRKLEILEISLEEEEQLTLSVITGRFKKAFDVDKVTKKFYDVFKTYKDKFQKFIEGIGELNDLEWYTSLMMNRLMFIYFIQKKGFLNGDKDYLRNRLFTIQKQKGKDKFFTFYKDFLRILFHGGLGTPEDERSDEIKELVGKVPYLNGGLFDEHQIEKEYPSINIPDSAFEKVFEFFDGWQWVLDDRPARNDKEINPEVIGYIFEKYINQKQMGAYYTKEDITEYISKNTIIPFIFQEAKKGCEVAFKPGSALWNLLKESPDRYIYDAVKHGVNEALPAEIEKGIDTTKPNLLERRKTWNKTAPETHALPTEIWREVVERRNRYFEIKKKLESGEINDINDLITYNLNIRQFAEDVIENADRPELIRTIYYTIAGRKKMEGSNAKPKQGISILDPTCGSGAFLFAALNILEPLYEACLERMKAFIEETNDKTRYKDFREILAESEKHPSLQYFIYKSIILNNLYGVDIMNEAVEIAKLRLFLKLVSQVETFEQIEALPDIDFNIRCGNTLVGFVTFEETKSVIESTLDFEKTVDKIEEKAQKAAMAFEHFKEMQIKRSARAKELHEAKNNLQTELNELNNELNVYLGDLYGKSPAKLKEFEKWKQSHQPFHWWVEYYSIIEGNKGFDVIIGNPPYVVYPSEDVDYIIKNYKTIACSNLYSYCVEKASLLINNNARFGMILPNSSISADKMKILQNIFIVGKNSWITNFAWRPSKLFEGANMLLAIILFSNDINGNVFSSKYLKWYNESRSNLFNSLIYFDTSHLRISGSIPKIPSNLFTSISYKLVEKSNDKKLINYFYPKPTKFVLYYFRAVLYWVKILTKKPKLLENGKESSTGEMKTVYCQNEIVRNILVSYLSSNIYYLYYTVYSSCQVINNRDFNILVDIESINGNLKNKLSDLSIVLQKDYFDNSKSITREYSKRSRTFTMVKQYFYLKKSKKFIDEIDKVLAKHYGFTDEELDFIINYDIKYRMGADTDEE